MSAYHGNNYLLLLERLYRAHRPVLFTLVDAIELEATSAEASVLDAVEFIRAHRDRRSDWIPETATVERDGQQTTVGVNVDCFASDARRKVLRDRQRPGMLARRHLEVCVFSCLARRAAFRGYRGGRLGLLRQPARQLMTWDECRPLAAEFCTQAGIPTEAAERSLLDILTRTAMLADSLIAR